MNETSTQSIVELTQSAHIHTGLSAEWKIVICVFAALAINLICVLFFCASKYRKKIVTDGQSASFLDLSRKNFPPNFPTMALVDTLLGAKNSRKTISRYEQNVVFHGSCPPGGKRIYKGKDVIY